MSKPIDFAKQRREQGRALSADFRELAELLGHEAAWRVALAQRSEERRLLTVRLMQSVVPLFIAGRRVPERIGSCVLVRLDSDLYAFTAAHVLLNAGNATLLAPSSGGKGGKLWPLPTCTARLRSSGARDDLDVAVLALQARELGPFQHHVFLTGGEIDQHDEPDDQGFESFYFVLGYPASRMKISWTRSHIDQEACQFSTSPVSEAEYVHERLSRTDHLMLDFDHHEIKVEGKRVAPVSKLQGVSGGGIFHIARKTKQGPLVAIATQNRRNSCLIVATRIKHFLATARELKDAARNS